MKYLWLLLFGASLSSFASDWPAFKADAARTSATEEQLSFPLKPGWIYRAPSPPQPAWLEPGRSINVLILIMLFSR
jgi:hypothetical protein